MSGGKGSASTEPMATAADASNALQEKMYNESVAREQPFYDLGLSGSNKLADYLGLQGGQEGALSREQLTQNLTPQYTTTGTEGTQVITGYTDGEKSNDGNIITRSEPIYSTVGGTSDSINYDALNTAVDEELAGQESGRPDYYGSLLKSFGQEDYQADPGYQFRLDEGNKALERNLAARGKTFSPEASKALQGYGQNLASEEYGNAYNRYNQDQTNVFNRLAGISGLGQQASQQLTGVGQNYSNQVGQTNASLANAQVSADDANRSRKQSMFNTLVGAGGSLGAAALMPSDETLKENIVKVGNENGHNIYHFNYKGGERRYEGVMAQEVLKTNPEAVTTLNGKLAVYYDKLGLEMTEVH
tara:strand:+ start:81 stop:1160 length:1080 start_codon:yes stop_codon:yes gene_type:complete